MLNFIETDNRYIIEETRLFPDEFITVKYTKDLRFKKVNKDPWNKATKNDISWFNRYYKHKFENDGVGGVHKF